MDGHDSEDPQQSTADMTVFLFAALGIHNVEPIKGCKIFFIRCNALDEMGSRIDELEQSINELRTEMGAESSPSPLAPSKLKPEDGQPADGSA